MLSLVKDLMAKQVMEVSSNLNSTWLSTVKAKYKHSMVNAQKVYFEVSWTGLQI